MNQAEIISNTRDWVKEQLLYEGSGHDWQHIRRVTKQAEEIAVIEGADLFIVTMAALLHDLIDDKVVESEEVGLQQVSIWLVEHNVSQEQMDHILTIITTMSFKGGNNRLVSTLEAKVVQDADRLDAIGAIGVARTFIYAGHKGHLMHDRTISIRDQMTVDEYRKGVSTPIAHFYEKLLKLKDLMNTKEGRRRAQIRHEFLEQFLQQFLLEWGEE